MHGNEQPDDQTIAEMRELNIAVDKHMQIIGNYSNGKNERRNGKMGDRKVDKNIVQVKRTNLTSVLFQTNI